MRFIRIIAGVLLACFVGSASLAATVQLSVSGTAFFVKDLPSGPIQNGQKVTASYVFDTGAAALASSSTSTIFPLVRAEFVYVDLGRRTVFDSSIWSTPFINTITVWGDRPYGQQITFETSDGSGSTGGLILNLPLGQSVDDSSLKPLVSVLQGGGASALSLTNPSLFIVGFDGSGWWGDCPYPQTNCQLYASVDRLAITNVQAVPVPAGLPLMALGLVGLGVVGRRQKV